MVCFMEKAAGFDQLEFGGIKGVFLIWVWREILDSEIRKGGTFKKEVMDSLLFEATQGASRLVVFQDSVQVCI